MIVITGAAGFIGSCLAHHLHRQGRENMVLVDDFRVEGKKSNWIGLPGLERVDRQSFFEWAEKQRISAVIHLGARTDTTEQNVGIFRQLNLEYSQRVWQLCAERGIPLIYASSAATYGSGELGFKDEDDLSSRLHPLNPYGWSKNEMDKWALQQMHAPPQWQALKFFNVYGPNEYHKGRMASVIFHAYQQILSTHKMKLFRSHRPEYADGEQLRDFVYVKDVCSVIQFFLEHPCSSGVYNLGSGEARTFLDLTRAVFRAMGIEESIEFIDTPIEIREAYQYFTRASMEKLQYEGYMQPFTSLEKGVDDYVKNYLCKGEYF